MAENDNIDHKLEIHVIRTDAKFDAVDVRIHSVEKNQEKHSQTTTWMVRAVGVIMIGGVIKAIAPYLN